MHYCSSLRVVKGSWSVKHPWKKEMTKKSFDQMHNAHIKTTKWKSYHREKKWKLAQEWQLAAHAAIQLDVSSPASWVKICLCWSIMMIMMMIMVMTTKNIEHGQTENHLYKLPHREHPKSRAGNDEYLHLAINLDFVSLLWKQLKINNSLTNSRLLLKYCPTIKVAASRAIPTPTPVCYMWY